MSTNKNTVPIKHKGKKVYKNKCVKCLCIVFCCHDDNIEDEEDPNFEDKQEFLTSKEIIGFEGPVNNLIISKDESETKNPQLIEVEDEELNEWFYQTYSINFINC